MSNKSINSKKIVEDTDFGFGKESVIHYLVVPLCLAYNILLETNGLYTGVRDRPVLMPSVLAK